MIERYSPGKGIFFYSVNAKNFAARFSLHINDTFNCAIHPQDSAVHQIITFAGVPGIYICLPLSIAVNHSNHH